MSASDATSSIFLTDSPKLIKVHEEQRKEYRDKPLAIIGIKRIDFMDHFHGPI